MSNNEYALVGRVIQDGDFASVIKAKITEDFFAVPVVREVFRFIRDTYHGDRTRGQVPSFQMVSSTFPGFHLFAAPDSVPLLCERLRTEKMKMDLLNLAQDLIVSADRDPLGAFARAKGELTKLNSLTEASDDISMANAHQLLREQYELVGKSGGVIGIPYPWEILNAETQGIQASQFIVLFGRPKSMKTWIAIHMGVCAYVRSRRRVLFYSREMGKLMICQRVAAAIAGVDYRAFKNGTLQPELKQKVFTILEELADDEKAATRFGRRDPYFVVTVDRSRNGGGISWLNAKINELRPDLVIVDGMYLMRDDRSNSRSVDWKNIANISQDMKGLAQEYEIPIIGVTQANRASDKSKGADLTELAYADALGQDADAVFRVSKTKNKETKATELVIGCPGLREGELDGFVINGRPASDFSFIRSYSSEEEKEYEEEKTEKKPRPSGTTWKANQGFMSPRIPTR